MVLTSPRLATLDFLELVLLTLDFLELVLLTVDFSILPSRTPLVLLVLRRSTDFLRLNGADDDFGLWPGPLEVVWARPEKLLDLLEVVDVGGRGDAAGGFGDALGAGRLT